MPLTLADVGVEVVIQRIGGSQAVKQHLENMGFVVGSKITVLQTVSGNLIVKVKECRVALNQDMAQKIII